MEKHQARWSFALAVLLHTIGACQHSSSQVAPPEHLVASESTRSKPVARAARVPLGHELETALPSWNDGVAKRSIVDFVTEVTTPGSPHFVPIRERIATIDNDGTLWAEKPVYAQLLFAVDRVKALAPEHPEWRHREPFASILKGDVKRALSGGRTAVTKLVMATHAGMTTEDFKRTVADWIAGARNPETKRLCREMVYQPMLELLAYLRAHDFKTYIVSGGGVDFMRPWAPGIYGVPPERIVGSRFKTEYQLREGRPVLVRQAELMFVDDKAGKPIAIDASIGRRPIFAFGNSDGDLQMLQWTAAGKGLRFMGLVHHTDGEREWAYDRTSPVGRLDKALDQALERGWTVVDMKRDWRVVFVGSPRRVVLRAQNGRG